MTLSLTINETLKWLSLLPILTQVSFWWWQCSDRYIISPSTPPPPPPFSRPSLIRFVVSVDVKHHAYLLASIRSSPLITVFQAAVVSKHGAWRPQKPKAGLLGTGRWGGRAWGMEVAEGYYTPIPTPCHHQNDSCFKIGSADKSHFNVPLIVSDKVTNETVSKDHNFWKKKKKVEPTVTV